jgi:hypothetical protein
MKTPQAFTALMSALPTPVTIWQICWKNGGAIPPPDLWRSIN